MSRIARRWVAGIAIGLATVLLAGAFLVHRFVPSDAELAALVSERFERSSGIALEVGAFRWSLRPTPVVEATSLATVQERPITVRRIVIRPNLSALWQRTISIDEVEIEGAMLPRASVRDFRGRFGNDQQAGAARFLGGPWKLAEVPLERLILRDITWIDRRDIALAYDADVRFDAHWRPRTVDASRRGVTPAAHARAVRDGAQDRWQVTIEAGGGSWNGQGALQLLDGGRLRVAATLSPRRVDIALLTQAFGRQSTIAGRFDGETRIDSEGDNAGDLIRNLRTRTRFEIRPATLRGFDLAKAVRTGGLDRSGQTPFDELTGVVQTQARDDGVMIRYDDLQARSGLLTASGHAAVFNRRLEGEAAIDLVDGVVGVPFKLAGTLDSPVLSLTGGAAAGAAIGTAILPGVGTAIGARIGQRMGRIFGDDSPPPAKRRSTPRTGATP